MLYATVRQRKIHVKNPVTVIQNGVNVDELLLDMDDEWRDMTSIVAVFTLKYSEIEKVEEKEQTVSKELAKEMLHIFGEPIMVPWECLQHTGKLSVSCTGYVGSEKVMTTMLPDSFWNVVQNGAMKGEETAEPTPSLYEQVLSMAVAAGEAATAATAVSNQLLQDKANGVFDGADGRGILSIASTSDGAWTIHYTDGSSEIIDNAAYQSLMRAANAAANSANTAANSANNAAHGANNAATAANQAANRVDTSIAGAQAAADNANAAAGNANAAAGTANTASQTANTAADNATDAADRANTAADAAGSAASNANTAASAANTAASAANTAAGDANSAANAANTAAGNADNATQAANAAANAVDAAVATAKAITEAAAAAASASAEAAAREAQAASDNAAGAVSAAESAAASKTASEAAKASAEQSAQAAATSEGNASASEAAAKAAQAAAEKARDEAEGLIPSLTAEEWTFTLEDGSTVTKAVYVG